MKEKELNCIDRAKNKPFQRENKHFRFIYKRKLSNSLLSLWINFPKIRCMKLDTRHERRSDWKKSNNNELDNPNINSENFLITFVYLKNTMNKFYLNSLKYFLHKNKKKSLSKHATKHIFGYLRFFFSFFEI